MIAKKQDRQSKLISPHALLLRYSFGDVFPTSFRHVVSNAHFKQKKEKKAFIRDVKMYKSVRMPNSPKLEQSWPKFCRDLVIIRMLPWYGFQDIHICSKTLIKRVKMAIAHLDKHFTRSEYSKHRDIFRLVKKHHCGGGK